MGFFSDLGKGIANVVKAPFEGVAAVVQGVGNGVGAILHGSQAQQPPQQYLQQCAQPSHCGGDPMQAMQIMQLRQALMLNMMLFQAAFPPCCCR